MPFDWGSFISDVAVPAGASIAGSVLGNRQQAKGIERSREAAGQAKTEAGGAITTGYGQGRSDLLNALNLAVASNAGNAWQQYINPFAAQGQQAATTTGELLGLPSTRPTFTAPGAGAAPFNAFKAFGAAPGGPAAATGLNALAGGGKYTLPGYQVPGSAAAKLGGALGTAGGAAIGAAVGGPLAPISALAGALAGPIIGHFTRKGREKRAASAGIDDYSNWRNSVVVPAFKSGQIDAATAKAALQQGFDAWKNWVMNSGTFHDDAVKKNSIASQQAYFDQGNQALFGSA
jgi:hypothetical protein